MSIWRKMHVLGSNFLGAHSLILSEQEKSLVMERGVKTCHCPFSNCGKAVPDTPQLLEMGIPVGPGFGRGCPRRLKPLE